VRTPAQKKPMKRIEDFILTRRIKWRTKTGKFSEDVCWQCRYKIWRFFRVGFLPPLSPPFRLVGCANVSARNPPAHASRRQDTFQYCTASYPDTKRHLPRKSMQREVYSVGPMKLLPRLVRKIALSEKWENHEKSTLCPNSRDNPRPKAN
jgi:hypothetical protein